MSIKKFFIPVALFLFFFNFPGLGNEFKIGEINRKVRCSSDKSISYSIFLPSGYTPKKKWPVIFAFEPAARVMIPLNLFKDVAEKYGYIIVCSDNVKNGPWKELINAANGVWRDINLRFSIDSGRVIAAGFSGGSRAASIFSVITDIIPSGIIACGAGLSAKPDYRSLSGSFYYGIVGEEDFNFSEMLELADSLKKKKIKHAFDIVTGPHKWPEKSALERAIKFIRVYEMGRGIVKTERNFINSVKKELTGYADSLIKKKRYFFGINYMNYIKVLLDAFSSGFKNEIKVKQNANGKNYNRDKKLIYKYLRDEHNFIDNFKMVFSKLQSSENIKRFADVKNLLKITEIEKNSQSRKIHKRSMARRLLYILSVKGWRFGYDHFRKKEYDKSLLFFRIALEANPDNVNLYFYLAKTYALKGDKKSSVKFLKKILDFRKDLSGIISKDKDFSSLRSDSGFMRILEKMSKLEKQ